MDSAVSDLRIMARIMAGRKWPIVRDSCSSESHNMSFDKRLEAMPRSGWGLNPQPCKQ
jgi:hypothetical protein